MDLGFILEPMRSQVIKGVGLTISRTTMDGRNGLMGASTLGAIRIQRKKGSDSTSGLMETGFWGSGRIIK